MSTPNGYTDDDVAGLTPEEIAALSEDDGAGDRTTLGESLNEDGTLKAAQNDDEAAARAQADADATAAAAKTAKDAADAEAARKTAEAAGKTGEEVTKVAPTEKVETVAKPDPLPVLEYKARDGAKEQLESITTQKGTLLEQFDNGDITAKEYQTQLDTLSREERAIERELDKEQTATELTQQRSKQSWLDTVNSFTTTQHPEYSTSKSRWIALDSYVREIANDKANAGLSAEQILAKAHSAVEADLGAVPGKKTDTTPAIDPKTGKPAVVDKEGKPLKGAKIEPVQTLRKVPAADNNDVTESRFSGLDKLADSDPLAYEERLMRMSANERDEYLASRTD
jgi:hypothetical protein